MTNRPQKPWTDYTPREQRETISYLRDNHIETEEADADFLADEKGFDIVDAMKAMVAYAEAGMGNGSKAGAKPATKASPKAPKARA